jgi:hypothetical protein
VRRRKGLPRMHTLVTEELRENFGEEGGREGRLRNCECLCLYNGLGSVLI